MHHMCFVAAGRRCQEVARRGLRLVQGEVESREYRYELEAEKCRWGQAASQARRLRASDLEEDIAAAVQAGVHRLEPLCRPCKTVQVFPGTVEESWEEVRKLGTEDGLCAMRVRDTFLSFLCKNAVAMEENNIPPCGGP